jgi:hypothetical protein
MTYQEIKAEFKALDRIKKGGGLSHEQIFRYYELIKMLKHIEKNEPYFYRNS